MKTRAQFEVERLLKLESMISDGTAARLWGEDERNCRRKPVASKSELVRRVELIRKFQGMQMHKIIALLIQHQVELLTAMGTKLDKAWVKAVGIVEGELSVCDNDFERAIIGRLALVNIEERGQSKVLEAA